MPLPHFTIGCVSYLNTTLLIAGLEEACPGRITLVKDVPANLLNGLESGRFDLALCPIVDHFNSPAKLQLVPVGGIASKGPTHTVKLFARKPINQCTTVTADTDSHTSVNLLRVLWSDHNPNPLTLIPHNYHQQPIPTQGDAALLIGDKVVTAPPPADDFPYTLDLGEAWLQRTGLPFVFACWMARPDTVLADLPDLLAHQLEHNIARLPDLATTAATEKHWPPDLALAYLRDILHFHIRDEELQAIQRFREDLASLDTSAAGAN